MKKVKIVPINESDLVALIDNIVTEAVAKKKKEWIAENAVKKGNTILETRIKTLEKKINLLTKTIK